MRQIYRPDSFCWCHDTEERITGRSYIVCFECGHVWTARDLRRAYRREAKQGVKLGWRADSWDTLSPRQWVSHHARRLCIRADRIGFCQECIHDF